MRLITLTTIALLLIALAPGIQAGTVTYTNCNGNAGFNGHCSGSGSAALGGTYSVEAWATGGYASFGSAAIMTLDNAQDLGGFDSGVSVSAYGGFLDDWTLTGGTGDAWVQLTIDVTGSITDGIVTTGDTEFCEGGCTGLQPRLDLTVNSGDSLMYYLTGSGKLVTDPFLVTLGQPFSVGINLFSIVWWPNSFNDWSSYTGNGTATLNFNQTGVLNAIRVYDAEEGGNEITGLLSLGAASGTELPLGGPAAVPEPAMWLLIGGGLLGFGALRRRR